MARILVIDDSKTVVASVQSALAIDGHEVEALECFVDLSNVLHRRTPDLIVLDLDIPWFPGVRLGSFIRDRCRSSVPMIVYSSRSRGEIADAVKTVGGVCGVEKSKPIVELRNAVNASLGPSAESA